MSKSSFYQLFLQTAGMPLKKYINFRRIECAKNLIIKAPQMPLQEVARAVGYNEISTFYRNFSQETGIAPADYRDANMQCENPLQPTPPDSPNIVND